MGALTATIAGNMSACSVTIRGGCDLAEPFAMADKAFSPVLNWNDSWVVARPYLYRNYTVYSEVYFFVIGSPFAASTRCPVITPSLSRPSVSSLWCSSLSNIAASSHGDRGCYAP